MERSACLQEKRAKHKKKKLKKKQEKKSKKKSKKLTETMPASPRSSDADVEVSDTDNNEHLSALDKQLLSR